MNGIDSICAILTAVVILCLVPAAEYGRLSEMLKSIEMEQTVSDPAVDPEYAEMKAAILGKNLSITAFSAEFKRNSELYPYVFLETKEQLETEYMEKGKIERKGRLILYGY